MNKIRPSAAISPYVEHIWEARFNTDSDPELSLKVVPNGFVELILHISERHCLLSRNGIWIPSPDYTIIGLFTEPYEVRSRGEVKTLGIRIKPEAVRNLSVGIGISKKNPDLTCIFTIGLTGSEFHYFSSIILPVEMNVPAFRL